ncbi:MAG: hypothetical protein R3Y53_04240 [Bacillota bacterium]
MLFLEELFVARNVDDLETVVYALQRDIPVARLYCVVYFEDRNRIELFSSGQLLSGYFKELYYEKARIAGVAYGKHSGMQLIADMCKETIRKGKDYKNPMEWVN